MAKQETKIVVRHHSWAKPGRRWWVERQTQVDGWFPHIRVEGAIAVSEEFPLGSVYPTKAAALAALKRWRTLNS